MSDKESKTPGGEEKTFDKEKKSQEEKKVSDKKEKITASTSKSSKPLETGTRPRVRSTSSLSSEDVVEMTDVTGEDEGAASSTEGRKRTTSQNYMAAAGLTSMSPPKFVSLGEIMQAASGLRDMHLVHEIAVNENFSLKKVQDTTSIQGIIRESMHKAFWDILREELAEDPPNYTQALNLLDEIKSALFSVLLPQHTKIREQISGILDSDLIKQQVEQGTLDFKVYAEYLVSVLSKLCAPVRDKNIKALLATTDVVDTFKGIMELLDLMHLDMANFNIRMVRPNIIACSVELERKRFSEFLAIQADGLRDTRKWLLRYIDTDQKVPTDTDYDAFIRDVYKRIFPQACTDLLDWPYDLYFPETFVLDMKRLHELQYKTYRLTAIGTILLIALSLAGPDLQSVEEFKDSLKEHVSILLENVRGEQDLLENLPFVAEQVNTELKKGLIKYKVSSGFQLNENDVKQQITDVTKPDHKVWKIIKQRVKGFVLDIIESSTADPQKVPSGLTALKKELTETAGQFLRIVTHNNSVFCIFYYQIISEALPKPS